MAFALAHFDEHRIVINALAGKDVPVIKPGRVAEQMPFADHARVIACGLQILRERRLAAVEPVEHRHPVEVAVFARQNGRAAGRADRVDDETIHKPHPVFGNAVDVWRLVNAAAVSADGMGRVIIGHDVKNVRSVALLGARRWHRKRSG